MIIPVLPGMVPFANAQQPRQSSCTLFGNADPFCVVLHPGVGETYKSGWSQTLDTLWGTQGTGDHPGTWSGNTQTRELFDSYLDYAILASASDSIGDLQFDFTIPWIAGVPLSAQWVVTRIDIFVPPEFEWLAPTRQEAVWTDITDDWAQIAVSRQNVYSPIAPSWVRVRLGQDYATAGRMNITADWQHTTDRTWHVRLFDLKAPAIAGLYHFKIYARIADGPATATIGYQSIGVGNFPVIVVKNELNPAWVEVTVRTHAFNAPPAAFGSYTSGKVVADGTTPEGREVQAWGFWSRNDFAFNDATPGKTGATYRLYLFGLAEGTYTLTAEASGFSPTTTDRFTVLAGQSYRKYIVIYDSPDVYLTVWSKHGTGAIPWHNLWQLPLGTNNPALAPNNALVGVWNAANYIATPAVRDILINLYDAEGNMIGWWASDSAHGVTAAAPWVGGFGGWLQKEIAPPNMLLGLHDDANAAIGSGGTVPTRTNYGAWLTDNVDMTWTWTTGAGGNARGSVTHNPSTQWDGHVPWDWADYVAGMPNGDYSVEAFVTGYIMDEADAFQRHFSLVGISAAIQMDLRRSNWIETTVYLPGQPWPLSAVQSTFTLVALDANGNERGAMTASVSTAAGVDGRIDGNDFTGGAYLGGVVIEGWNAVYPNALMLPGASGSARDPAKKDYGLNPMPSSHSPEGPVELAGNPYSLQLYFSDMGIPWARLNGTGWYNIIGGDPQVSVALCNSPVLLSFSVANSWLWISLRSTDFEVPAHSRPWTFPGSEIWVDFINEEGTSQTILDPTLYGLIQDAGTTNATLGWRIPGTNPAVANFAAHGYGVSPFDIDNALNATGLYANEAGRHEHVGVFFYGSDWASPVNPWMWNAPYEYALMGDYRSTRLPPGQYTYHAYTHGYVMRRSFPVMVPFSSGADIEADLIQGGQIRVYMDFLHEGIRTPFNGFVRVEAFNSADEMVGASIYGQAEPNLFTQQSNGGAYLGYQVWADWMLNYTGSPMGPAQAADFGQRINIPGTYVEAANTFPSSSVWANGQRAWISSYFYSSKLNATGTGNIFRPIPGEWNASSTGVLGTGILGNTWGNWFNSFGSSPGVGTGSGYPGLRTGPTRYGLRLPYTVGRCGGGCWHAAPNRLQVPATGLAIFDVYGFYWYFGDPTRTWAGGWPTVNGFQMSGSWIDKVNGGNWWMGTDQWDYGIPGSVDIPNWEGSGGGLYSVKVWAFDPMGANGVYDAAIPVDDWRMFAQGWELTNVQVPWGGAVELWIDMNDMAKLTGTVRWFDMFGNLRALPWAQVSASPGPETDSYPAYATGLGAVGLVASHPAGAFIMWLPAGSHDVSVSTSEAPGVWSSSAPTFNAEYTAVVSPGWVGSQDTNLAGSGVPVPEMPPVIVAFGLFAALAASAWLLRKQNLSTPLLMK